ncbi:MAG: DNA repair protein RadA [Micropruina sp.]
MAKPTGFSYRCTECGWTTVRWVGRCGECQTWGSVEATHALPQTAARPTAPTATALPITEVSAAGAAAVPSGIAELDRVLGTGLVPGAVLLLAGEPGVGKSTLLLEVASRWARTGRKTLYISAEEAASQVRLRADRTSSLAPTLYLAAETDLGAVLAHIEQLSPELLVLDSIQTVAAGGTDGVAGGVSQVREVTSALVRVAKRRGMAVVLVGHVTKDGAVAGPRTLEHLVDVVLNFDGDRHSGFRTLRAAKNRYGPADEVGCFQMTDKGIIEVPDPSGFFISARAAPVPGTCVTVTMEGQRPLLGEIQALVAPSSAPAPRRVTHGLDSGRVSMLLAVLQRKAGIKLHNREVYATTVGGARVSDPAVDLATAVAIASAASEAAFHRHVIALGEVALSGELRGVPALERRLLEAKRLGFDLAIVPEGSTALVRGIKVIESPSLLVALELLHLRGRPKRHGAESPGR